MDLAHRLRVHYASRQEAVSTRYSYPQTSPYCAAQSTPPIPQRMSILLLLSLAILPLYCCRQFSQVEDFPICGLLRRNIPSTFPQLDLRCPQFSFLEGARFLTGDLTWSFIVDLTRRWSVQHSAPLIALVIHTSPRSRCAPARSPECAVIGTRMLPSTFVHIFHFKIEVSYRKLILWTKSEQTVSVHKTYPWIPQNQPRWEHNSWKCLRSGC